MGSSSFTQVSNRSSSTFEKEAFKSKQVFTDTSEFLVAPLTVEREDSDTGEQTESSRACSSHQNCDTMPASAPGKWTAVLGSGSGRLRKFTLVSNCYELALNERQVQVTLCRR